MNMGKTRGTPEQQVKREICDFLSLYPHRCIYTVHIQMRGKYKSTHVKNGWPDVSGIWDKWALFIEIKAPGGKVSSEQASTIQRVNKLGHIGIIAFSLEDVTKRLLGG